MLSKNPMSMATETNYAYTKKFWEDTDKVSNFILLDKNGLMNHNKCAHNSQKRAK